MSLQPLRYIKRLSRPAILCRIAFLFISAIGFAESSNPVIHPTAAAIILKSGDRIEGGYLGGDEEKIYLFRDGKVVMVPTKDADTLIFPDHPVKVAKKPAKAKKRKPATSL